MVRKDNPSKMIVSRISEIDSTKQELSIYVNNTNQLLSDQAPYKNISLEIGLSPNSILEMIVVKGKKINKDLLNIHNDDATSYSITSSDDFEMMTLEKSLKFELKTTEG